MDFLKKYGAVIVTVVSTIAAAVFTPDFIAAHPQAFALLNVIAQVLHAALPSVFTGGGQQAQMKKLGMFIVAMLLVLSFSRPAAAKPLHLASRATKAVAVGTFQAGRSVAKNGKAATKTLGKGAWVVAKTLI